MLNIYLHSSFLADGELVRTQTNQSFRESSTAQPTVITRTRTPSLSRMPSKIQLDENLWFLYICLQKSDYKAVGPWRGFFCLPTADVDGKIDFNAVGDATKLKPPAARMRYTRLRRAIEGGTLIGTHGTPFQGGAEKSVEVRKKRKGLLLSTSAEDLDELEPIVTRSGSRIVRTGMVEGGSADQDDTEQSTDDKKAPSMRRRARALKRKVDPDEEMSGLAPDVLRSGQRNQNPDQHAQIPSPKVESEGDVDSKFDLTAEGKQPTKNGHGEETSDENIPLAPRGIQHPVYSFKSSHERVLTLRRGTDEILPTGATTAETRLLLKAEDDEAERFTASEAWKSSLNRNEFMGYSASPNHTSVKTPAGLELHLPTTS